MEIIMKKKIISLKSVFLLVLAALMLSFSAHPAMAASASDNVNGKYVYFSAQNVIWKMQTTTGKCSRVKTFSGVGSVDDVTYHKGYLYFSTYTGGSDVGVSYVCRMKTSGKDYERLALGYNPAVCGDTIIYAYCAESEYDYSYTEYLGIGSMEPDGSNSRLLVESTFDFWINPDFQILNDRIFFSGYSSEEGCYAIYSCDMDGDDMTADIPEPDTESLEANAEKDSSMTAIGIRASVLPWIRLPAPAFSMHCSVSFFSASDFDFHSFISFSFPLDSNGTVQRKAQVHNSIGRRQLRHSRPGVTPRRFEGVPVGNQCLLLWAKTL